MNEQELFVEYPGLTNAGSVPSYYRIKVDAMGRNGKVDYRSGWYDASAVDAIFGDIDKKAGADAATAVRRRQAIATLFDEYMDALEEGKSNADVLAAKNRYEEVLGNASGVTTAGDTPTSALDHANEKFVMVFASDPDRIIEAIKNALQQNKVSKAIQNAFALQNRSHGTKSRMQLHLLAADLASLVNQIEAARDGTGAQTTVQQMQTVVDVLIASLEADL